MFTSAQKTVFVLSLIFITLSAQTAGFVQKGLYLHDIANSQLTISHAKSGLVCSNASGPEQVCTPTLKVVVSAQEMCEYSPEKEYPCIRYGYEFNYANAQSGDTLDCKAIYTDARGSNSKDYSHQLSAKNGHIFHHAFKSFAPVKERVILSEVHECSYQGSPLMVIEFMHYYEPGNTTDNNASKDKKRIDTLPNACEAPHLSETKAERVLNSNVRIGAGTEHIPTFWSQCIYKSESYKPREVSYVYKFMLSDMFDVNRVEPEQLTFNATFASGNADLTRVINDLGDKAFVFNTEKRTTLLVITGIGGPKNGSNRDTEFIANYYLNDKNMPKAEREAILIKRANEDLQIWQ